MYKYMHMYVLGTHENIHLMSSLELLWNMNLMSIKVVKITHILATVKIPAGTTQRRAIAPISARSFSAPHLRAGALKVGERPSPILELWLGDIAGTYCLPSFLFSLYAKQGSDLIIPGWRPITSFSSVHTVLGLGEKINFFLSSRLQNLGIHLLWKWKISKDTTWHSRLGITLSCSTKYFCGNRYKFRNICLLTDHMGNTLQLTNRKTEPDWTLPGLVVIGQWPAYSMRPYWDPPIYQQGCPRLLCQPASPRGTIHGTDYGNAGGRCTSRWVWRYLQGRVWSLQKLAVQCTLVGLYPSVSLYQTQC